MKTEYRFVWDIGPSLFESHVTSLLESGWRLVGGAITWKEGRHERRFGQAMTRTMVREMKVVDEDRCETCGATMNKWVRSWGAE